MFANAYGIASSFTLPVIVSVRCADKSVGCSLGCFVVINPEGWIVTVAHVFEPFLLSQKHALERSAYAEQVSAIGQDGNLSSKQRAKRIAHLSKNPKWITNVSIWWATDGVELKEYVILPEADLAIGRLVPFDSRLVSAYPTLKDPSRLSMGTSLCKLGYPFHQIQATFDEASSDFQIPPSMFPIPRFPLEGIYTRDRATGQSRDGSPEIKYLETSSPGLRGQSGGPIFDSKGTVWAIQSRTENFPLGFSPKIVRNDREIEENQFLNVGLGVHPETLIWLLNKYGVKFNLSDY
jgi:hypothetical protein